ncbi:MAG: hypothetical protein VXW65_06945 [Pseudomonadota bacterium]|nr:hypothetical protein [Pseudomonadota bacterium]
MNWIDLISIGSVLVIALVCASVIIQFHDEVGLVVTLCLFVLLCSCVGLAFDESDGSPTVFSQPIFRVSAAMAIVLSYWRFRRFWLYYGVFLRRLRGI